MDALLGGYASSDDEITNEQTTATSAAAPSSDAATPAAAAAPPSSGTASAAAAAPSLPEKLERKRLKQEKKERKAAKLAAAAASSSVTDAPLPAPKLILPSASSALSAQSSRGAPTFLSLQAADRAREALQLAEQSGSVVARSVPCGLHAEAAARNLAVEQARDAQRAATEEMLSAPERESKSAKRKLLQNAQARIADGEPSPAQIAAAYAASSGKKQRLPSDGTGGPARASDQVKDKEKLKRGKGQSGIESGWKPEAWMQNRQNFDS